MQCPKCKYEWNPRSASPKACPRCKQYFWTKEKAKPAPKSTKTVDEVLGPRTNAPIDGLNVAPAAEETPKCGKCKRTSPVQKTLGGWRCTRCNIAVEG